MCQSFNLETAPSTSVGLDKEADFLQMTSCKSTSGIAQVWIIPQCYYVLHELYFCESIERWRHPKEKIIIIKLVGVAFDMCGGNIDVEPNERYLAVPGEAAAMDVSV